MEKYTELLFSGILASCTAAYAWINYKIFLESRATREQKITPLIIAFLKVSESRKVLTLHLKNIGEGVAKNVKIKLIKDFHIPIRENLPLSEIGIFKNNFNVFPPEYEIEYILGIMTEIDFDAAGSLVKLEISYEGIDGKEITNMYDLPFNQIIDQNSTTPPQTYMGSISYYLEKISNTLQKNK